MNLYVLDDNLESPFIWERWALSCLKCAPVSNCLSLLYLPLSPFIRDRVGPMPGFVTNVCRTFSNSIVCSALVSTVCGPLRILQWCRRAAFLLKGPRRQPTPAHQLSRWHLSSELLLLRSSHDMTPACALKNVLNAAFGGRMHIASSVPVWVLLTDQRLPFSWCSISLRRAASPVLLKGGRCERSQDLDGGALFPGAMWQKRGICYLQQILLTFTAFY